MPRTIRGSMLAVTALTIGLSACQGTSASPPPAGAASRTNGSADEAVYVTGAKPDDDACTRVVSAIGYVELSLLPSGQEEAQHFDGDVRGRFGYLRGTLQMYGPHLPASLSGATATIERVGTALSTADTPPGERPALLREYREASRAITTTCQKS